MANLLLDINVKNSVNLGNTVEGEFFIHLTSDHKGYTPIVKNFKSEMDELTPEEYTKRFNEAYKDFIEFFLGKREELEDLGIDLEDPQYSYSYNQETKAYLVSQSPRLNNENKESLKQENIDLDLDLSDNNIQVFTFDKGYYVSDRTQDVYKSYIIKEGNVVATDAADQALVNEVIEDFSSKEPGCRFKTVSLLGRTHKTIEQSMNLTIGLEKEITEVKSIYDSKGQDTGFKPVSVSLGLPR